MTNLAFSGHASPGFYETPGLFETPVVPTLKNRETWSDVWRARNGRIAKELAIHRNRPIVWEPQRWGQASRAEMARKKPFFSAVSTPHPLDRPSENLVENLVWCVLARTIRVRRSFSYLRKRRTKSSNPPKARSVSVLGSGTTVNSSKARSLEYRPMPSGSMGSGPSGPSSRST